MNYYKILNESETHNNLKYKTGLNVDLLPFNPNGSCEPGGIYFSREDILAFLGYGPYIRKVTIPEDAQVYENPRTPKKWKADKVILGRKRKITHKLIKQLVAEGADIHAHDDYVLCWASECGNLELIKYLVENGANIHAQNDYPLRWASECGHLKTVKYLVENGANIHVDNDLALCWASRNGHLKTVKYLVENGANIHAWSNYSLCQASRRGHLKVVKYLESIINKE